MLAGFFLALFAFSITPRLALHNLVATHKDGGVKASLCSSTNQYSTASFNCQCDTQVSESPFVEAVDPASSLIETAFETYKNVYVEAVYSSQHYSSALRGPPAC